MKRIGLIALALVVLLAAPASAATMQASMIADGKLLDAFGLPDGGGLVLTSGDVRGIGYLELTHATASGETQAVRAMQPDLSGVLASVFVSVCAERVQVFANYYLNGDPAAGRVYRYVFMLDSSTGVCEWKTHRVYIPWAE